MRHEFVTYTRADTHVENRLKSHGHNPNRYNISKFLDDNNLRTVPSFTCAVIIDLPEGDLEDLIAPYAWDPTQASSVMIELRTGTLTITDADGEIMSEDFMEHAPLLMAEVRQKLAERGVHIDVSASLVTECDVLAGVRS